MASNIYAIKCPCCGRSAIEDYYYKTDEKYTYCIRCGFNYSKTIEKFTEKEIIYKEEKNDGHGVFVLVNKDKSRKNIALESKITEDQLEEFKELYMEKNVNQAKSYLVSFESGIFRVLIGNPPENFYLPFEEYKEKMFAKYGAPKYEFMVRIEE